MDTHASSTITSFTSPKFIKFIKDNRKGFRIPEIKSNLIHVF